jgi:hypothetical protein
MGAKYNAVDYLEKAVANGEHVPSVVEFEIK